MLPELRGHAAVQNGLFTRAQAIAAGYRERQLRTLLRPSGEWVTVRRGIYMERQLWDSLDERLGKWVARDWAAHLSMDTNHVLSHDSAARAHAIPMLDRHLGLVHVTRPWVTGGRTDIGVKHHLAKLEPGRIETVAGLPVTGLARTAIDLAREHGELAGMIASDHALRRGVSGDDMEAMLGAMHHWPGITRAQRAVARADPGADNIAETLARDLIEEAGIGTTHTQFPVRLHGRTAWADIRVHRHLFEIHGFVKFVPASAGGVAEESAERVLFRQMTRQTDIAGQGFGVSQLVWDDFLGRRRTEAIRRIAREYAVTLERFGTQLTSEMREFETLMQEERRRRIFGYPYEQGA